VVLAAMGVSMFVGMVLPWVNWDKVVDAIEEWKRPAERVAVVGPTVLLVSAMDRDRFLVKSTMEPRGYTMRAVDSVEQGNAILNEEGAQIAMVIVDSAVSESRKLIQASRGKFPHARLIELHGWRDATQISSVLVNAVTGS
jgi:hypothetical protein